MAARPDYVTVQVPATSANLGPGFDCLGVALQIYLRVDCQRSSQPLTITISGSEPGDISTDASNHIYRAMQLVFQAAGVEMPGVALHIENGIPVSRGLGSSAAAATAGLVLANHLLGSPFDHDRLLAIGLPLEGHPDNLAPALFGGLTVSVLVDEPSPAAPGEGRVKVPQAVDASQVTTLPVPLRDPPQVVLYIPDFVMCTKEARRVLPSYVPRADAVFNIGRAALLVAALSGGDSSALGPAMEDRLHQPYRSAIFPALPRLITAAREAGAYGAALSGAGSTVIALSPPQSAHAVSAALEVEAAANSLTGHGVLAAIDTEGARIVNSSR